VISRRTFTSTVTLGLLSVPLASQAQQARNIPRIGWLNVGEFGDGVPFLEAFQQGLRELGYVEGQNILLEPRLKVEVIVASGPMIQAAVKATDTIPIVMSAAGDPVVRLEVFEARDREALTRAFETASKARVDGLIVFPGPLGLQYRQRIR